jgi:4-amino-4-deoxy-L-arabinose transferase-like glycosyltransferase
VTGPVASDAAATARSPHDRSFLVALGVVALGALVVRVLVIVLVDPHVPRLGDASAYHLLANNLADGRGYIRPFDLLKFHLVVPTAEYPPLHPFVVSLFARAGLRSVEAQRIGLAVIGSTTVAMVGVLGRRVSGTRVGLVAAGIAAVSPMMFLPEATLMSETVFVFLVTTSLVLALRAYERPTVGRIVLLGVVLGFAVLARAEAGVLGVLLLGGLLWTHRGLDGAPVIRRLGLAVLGLVLMAAVVVPWTIRNQRTFHELVPVSNNLGTALAGANCGPTYGGTYLGSWRSTFGAGDASAGQCFTGFNGSQPHFNEARAAADARHAGITYARDHTGDLPKVALARLGRTFGVFRPGQQIELEALEGRPKGWERAGTWLEWALYPLAIGGAVVLVRRRAPVWPLAAALASVVVSTLVTYVNQRFRIGAEPAILVAAATALVTLVRPAPPPGTADARR